MQNAVIAHNTIIHQHAGSSIWFATLPGNSNIQVINNLVSGNIPTAKNATYEGNINNVSYVATVFQPKYIVPQEGRDKGIKNNITNIDFGGNIRDDKPDVGAWEIGSNTTATLTPTQDQSPPTVQTPTPTSTIQSNTKPKIKITKKVLISKNAKEYFNYFTATDTDTSDVLKMSVTGLPDGITLKSCNNTKNDNEVSLKCQVSGTPNKKGKYSITITVSDDKNNSTTKKFTFRVW